MYLFSGPFRKLQVCPLLAVAFAVFFGLTNLVEAQHNTPQSPRAQTYKKPVVSLGSPVSQATQGRRRKNLQASQVAYNNPAGAFGSATEIKTQLESAKKYNVPSTWSGSISTGFGKSMAAYTDWDGSVGAGVGYQTSIIRYTASLDYTYQLDNYTSKTEDKIYGVSDLRLSALTNDFLDSPSLTLIPYMQLTLPTSKISQEASLQSSLSLGIKFHQKTNIVNWGTGHEIIGSFYRFETSDEAGTSYNSPAGFLNSLGLDKSLGPLNFAASYALYTYYNYANNTNNLQIVFASVSYSFTKNFSSTVYYRWRDQMLSNYKAFSDDTSKTGFLLTYTM